MYVRDKHSKYRLQDKLLYKVADVAYIVAALIWVSVNKTDIEIRQFISRQYLKTDIGYSSCNRSVFVHLCRDNAPATYDKTLETAIDTAMNMNETL